MWHSCCWLGEIFKTISLLMLEVRGEWTDRSEEGNSNHSKICRRASLKAEGLQQQKDTPSQTLMSLDFCCNIQMVGWEFIADNMTAWLDHQQSATFTRARLQNIIEDSSHAGHHLFNLLPSGRCYRSIRAHPCTLQKASIQTPLKQLTISHNCVSILL